MSKQITIKVWRTTLKKLRMLHALTGKSMVAILERLVSEELERVQKTEVNES